MSILAANPCRSKAPTIFTLDDLDDFSRIKQPNDGDIAMMVAEGSTSFWVFNSEFDGEIDGFNAVAGGCQGAWLLGSGEINPILFGMIDTTGMSGDELTDSAAQNSTALTNAVTLANGRPIHIPSGRYRINAVNLTSPIFGDGDSTILEPTATMVVAANGVSIKTLKYFSFTLVPTSTLVAVQIENPVFESVTYDWDASVASQLKLAIDSSFTEGLRIESCKFFKAGIQSTRAYNSVVIGNYFDMEWSNQNEPIHFSQFSRGIISGNTILNTLTDAIDLFSNGDLCVVANNRIIGVGEAGGPNLAECCITLKVSFTDGAGGSSGQGGLGWVEKTIVTGNVIENFNPASDNGRWFGIQCVYDDSRAVPSFSLAEATRNCVISNNIISGFWTTNPDAFARAYFAGIRFVGYGAVITGNNFNNISNQADAAQASETCGVELGWYTSSGGAPVAMPQSAASCLIENNVYNGDGSGIIIYRAADCVLSGNVVSKDHANNRNPRYGFVIKGPVDRCQIKANNISLTFASPAAFAMTSVGSYTAAFADCLFEGNISMHPWGIDRATRCSFLGNVTGAVTLGVDGTEQIGNTFSGNRVQPSSNALNGLTLLSESGFIVTGNQFTGCQNAVLVDGSPNTLRAHDSLIKNNISLSEVAGTFVSYTNVSAGTKLTLVVLDNFSNNVLASSNGNTNIAIGGTLLATDVSAAGNLTAGNSLGFTAKGLIVPDTDGVFTLWNNAGTTFGLLQFGGRSSGEPALKRVGAAIEFRLADDSGRARFLALSGNLSALVEYANNGAAIAGGLGQGDLYRETGSNPAKVCVVT